MSASNLSPHRDQSSQPRPSPASLHQRRYVVSHQANPIGIHSASVGSVVHNPKPSSIPANGKSWQRHLFQHRSIRCDKRQAVVGLCDSPTHFRLASVDNRDDVAERIDRADITVLTMPLFQLEAVVHRLWSGRSLRESASRHLRATYDASRLVRESQHRTLSRAHNPAITVAIERDMATYVPGGHARIACAGEQGGVSPDVSDRRSPRSAPRSAVRRGREKNTREVGLVQKPPIINVVFEESNTTEPRGFGANSRGIGIVRSNVPVAADMTDTPAIRSTT